MGLNYSAAVNITANYSGQGQVNKANEDFRNLGTNVKGIRDNFQSAGSALKTLAQLFVVRETFEFAKSLLEIGQGLDLVSQKTGISVQTLSDLKAAAENNGVNFEHLDSSLKKFSVSLAKANYGNAEGEAGFKKLGVSLKDSNGNAKTSGEVLLDLADGFSKMKDGPAKAAAAVAIFGRAGTDIVPVLNQGRAAIEGFGLKISDDFADRAHVFIATMEGIKRSVQQSGINALSALLPTLQEIAQAFIEFNKSAGPQDGLQKVTDGIRIAAVALVGFSTYFMEGLDTIYTGLDQLGTFLGEWIANRVDRIKTFGEEFAAFLKGGFDKARAIEAEFQLRTLDSQKRVGEETLRIREEYAKRSEERIKKLQTFSDSVTKNLGKNSSAAADTAPNVTRKGDGLGGFDPAQYKLQTEAIKRQKDALKELEEAGDLERQKLGLSTAEYKKRDIALKDSLAADKATVGFSEENRAAYKKVTAAIIEQKQAMIDLEEQQKHSFGQGAQEAWKEYLENAQDVAKQTKAMFSRAFSNMEDTFVNFVKTGKLSFKSLADAIEDDLIRIAFRQAVVFGATAALGGGSFSAAFANGGIMTGSGSVPLHKYASGGVVSSPQLALFGEGSTPEAFVPLPDGRAIPVNMRGGGGGGTSVQINVTVASDGTTTQNGQADGERGKQLGNLISSAVTSELIKQKRPGGLLA